MTGGTCKRSFTCPCDELNSHDIDSSVNLAYEIAKTNEEVNSFGVLTSVFLTMT